MKKKNKDPYPIIDVYHVTDTLVDGACVVVTDLCENLSNSIDTYDESIFDDLKKIDSKKFNSISVSNGADGCYPVWVGVDKFNKVKKIFASVNGGLFGGFSIFNKDKNRKLVSWSFNKKDLNDQFFYSKDKKTIRKKIFDMEVNSGAISIADYGGNFRFEHDEYVTKSVDAKYFKENGVYKNNYPIGLYNFHYGPQNTVSSSSFKSSKIHNKKIVNINEFKKTEYTEFLSRLLNEDCYPTKYIFEKYLIEEDSYRDDIKNLKIKNEKISVKYLVDRLPKALEILKKQNKILFRKNFNQVHEIRKKQFENFINSIIKDLTSPNLNQSHNMLTLEKPGLHEIQDTFYEGYKLKSEPLLSGSATIPVKNGKYPCYVHSYTHKDYDDDYEYANTFIVVEGIEGCYLNRNKKGKIFFDNYFKKSISLEDQINKKSKIISLDKVDLRKTDNLNIFKRISFVEDLELHGLQNFENWNDLSKLKKLKKLKLISCDISFKTNINFFKNLYSLPNLEEFVIDDSCNITTSGALKKKFPKNLYFKKLKSYKIIIRDEWMKSEHKDYQNYKGYGGKDLYFLTYHLPNIFQFPNFEKFKSLEKINLYNFFTEEQKEGELFNYEVNYFKENITKIKKVCKNSKVKEIFIHGYKFKNLNELANTRFLDAAIKLTSNTNAKINGVNQTSLNKILKKPLSASKEKINKIILSNKIEEFYENKLISNKDKTLTLNYFAIINDKENRALIDDAFSKPIEELIIKPAYQFFRSESVYFDTFDPVLKFIEKNNHLKKLILEEDGLSVDGHADMDGRFGHEESHNLNKFILNLFKKNKNLQIIFRHTKLKKDPSQKLDLNKTIDLERYIQIFEMYRILDDSDDMKKRFFIENLDRKEVDKIVENYFFEKVNSIVVIDDNFGWNESKVVRDIELIDKYVFEDPSPFTLNLGRVATTVSYTPDKNYPKECEFLNEMYEDGSFFDFSSRYKHFSNNADYYEPVIFVKKKFLDNSKKIIFKNIRHYYYFCKPTYRFDDYDNLIYNKFWKPEEKFQFPKSVKFNQLETLNIYGGREVNIKSILKNIPTSNLKQIILLNCLGKKREIPFLPNLESFVIRDGYVEKSKSFTNFSNLPNLKNLELLSLYNTSNNNGRWMTTEFDFTDIYKLSKLNYLNLGSINPIYLPPLKTLKNLEELDISLKLITADMYSDEGTIDENITDESFEFLKALQKLKKLKINLSLPQYHSLIKGPKLLSFVKKSLEDLNLNITYLDENIIEGNNTINYICKNFKKLKKLALGISRNEKFESIEKTNITYFRKTGEKWGYDKVGPRPFRLDLKQISKLNNLEHFKFYNSDDMGFEVLNPISISKTKKLKKINIDNEKFSTKDLETIKNNTVGKRDKFLNEKKKKNKSITSEYDLSEKDKKLYDKFDRELNFGSQYTDYAHEDIETILSERKKKKK